MSGQAYPPPKNLPETSHEIMEVSGKWVSPNMRLVSFHLVGHIFHFRDDGRKGNSGL